MFSTNSQGNANTSHVSLWFIKEQVFPRAVQGKKRSAVEAYVQLLNQFKNNVLLKFSTVIEGVVIGLGQDGQLKFSNERFGQSDFCTDGDFQIYDEHALNYLQNKIAESKAGGIELPLAMAWTQNSYLLFLETLMMDLTNLIFDHIKTKKFIKIPSIHWQVTGNRTPEKRSGLIVDGSEDYEEFFKIAAGKNFGIIFDGLAIDKREDCQSDPSILVEVFRQSAKKYNVPLVGENVKKIEEERSVAQVLEEA